jgi:rubredoxin
MRVSAYKSAADRDPSGVWFVDPVKKGFLWDKGCCGMLALGIVVLGTGVLLLIANFANPAVTIGVLVLGVGLMIAGSDWRPARHPVAGGVRRPVASRHGEPKQACDRCGRTTWQQMPEIGDSFGAAGAKFQCRECGRRRSFHLVDGEWRPVFGED